MFASFTAGIPPLAAPDATQPFLVVPPTAQERYIDGNSIKRGYVESWNLVVEREMPWQLFTTVAYVGTQQISSTNVGGRSARPAWWHASPA